MNYVRVRQQTLEMFDVRNNKGSTTGVHIKDEGMEETKTKMKQYKRGHWKMEDVNI
jgi:hypothetical protein